jgi:ribosome-binding factor A
MGRGEPSQRQLRVGELIRRALSELLARGDVHDPDLSEASITVGEVRASPDLKVATVHVLPLGGGGAEAVIEALERNRHEIRRRVARAVALKFSPELRFCVDDTFDRLDGARRLFAQEAVRRDVEVGEAEEGEEPPEDWPPQGWHPDDAEPGPKRSRR